jgi:anionic cell wall polymer biosynthesis LytR-Cps2A-Psr (LCP) family protein
MKKSRLDTWIVAAAVATVLVLSGVASCTLANRSLGPELQVTSPTATSAPLTDTAITDQAQAQVSPEPAQISGLCGQQGSVTVLLLGESLPEDQPLRGASAIRLVRVDYDTRTIRVLALPPYLWVPTPVLAAAGIDANALTRVYWDSLPLGTGSERARMAYATNVFAQTLADSFALVPDNYVTLKQGTFVDMIDAVGGLSIDLPEDVDGSPSGARYFYAGAQVMDGQAALDYARIYPAVGDTSPIEWERLERQRQVVYSLGAQLTRPQNVVRLPALIRQFYQDLVTDLSLNEAYALACVLQAPDVSFEDLALSPDMVTVGPDEMLMPKMEQIRAFLESSFIQ